MSKRWISWDFHGGGEVGGGGGGEGATMRSAESSWGRRLLATAVVKHPHLQAS